MLNEKKYIRAILLFIPTLTIIWGIILSFLSGPFYLSRSDPEYVYLLNGMNVSLFDFDRIGHADHPGTPFQILTGIFIRLIYLFSGNGSLVGDVISNPEKYLALSSFFLSVITAGLFYKISAVEYKRSKSLFGALIIPFVFGWFLILIDIPSRYTPDRALMILMLIFTLVTIKYVYLGLNLKKFAIYSGIIMAVGFTTKINFFPFLILPLFLITGIKKKITYGITLSISILVFFMIIHHKFTEFWRFTIGVLSKDGLHGTGEENVINTHTFYENLGGIVSENFALLFILLIALFIIILFFIKRDLRRTNKKEYLFILGYLLVSIVSILIVAKHYKNSYLIPVMSASGLVIYFVWSLSSKLTQLKYIPHVLFSSGLIFILINGSELIPRYEKRGIQLEQDRLTQAFIRNNVPAQDYFLVEPTWLAGPMKTNALVYGMSYINKKSYYYNELEKIYPNIITYEGAKDTLSHFRMVQADNESILKSGSDIYLLSTPRRHAVDMFNYLDSCANNFDIPLKLDTLFVNESLQQYVLKVNNNGNWRMIFKAACGFENEKNGNMRSDDGQTRLLGSYTKSNKRSADGMWALKLDQQQKQSPKFQINHVNKGDHFLVSIKRQRGGEALKGKLVVQFSDSENGEITIIEQNRLNTISSKWELVRLSFTMDHQPVDHKLNCYFEYSGERKILVDDFKIQHYSQQFIEIDELEE